MPNANVTKRAIADSFKKLMETTPFDRISVSSITDGCERSQAYTQSIALASRTMV